MSALMHYVNIAVRDRKQTKADIYVWEWTFVQYLLNMNCLSMTTSTNNDSENACT